MQQYKNFLFFIFQTYYINTFTPNQSIKFNNDKKRKHKSEERVLVEIDYKPLSNNFDRYVQGFFIILHYIIMIIQNKNIST